MTGRKPGTPILRELPPLDMVAMWREQGLSPQEVFQKCEDLARLRNRNKYFPDGEPVANGHPRHHKHDAQVFWELYQEHTLKEVGKIVGLTTERVRQILHEAGYNTRLHTNRSGGKRKHILPVEQLVSLRQNDGLLLREIADRFGVSISLIGEYLNGIERPKQLSSIGCPRCKTDPKARGLCNACYVKWFKRGKPL